LEDSSVNVGLRDPQSVMMGAMFVAKFLCTILYIMVQRKMQPVFWDTFMKFQLVMNLSTLVNKLHILSTDGMFLTGMVGCAMEKYTGRT
jgi:hypothetical protein